VFPGAVSRWEQHSEFTTYTWILNGADQTPGPHLVSIDLRLGLDQHADIAQLFDPYALAASQDFNGHASILARGQHVRWGNVRCMLDRRQTGASSALATAFYKRPATLAFGEGGIINARLPGDGSATA
jgi:hypothetical protein